MLDKTNNHTDDSDCSTREFTISIGEVCDYSNCYVTHTVPTTRKGKSVIEVDEDVRFFRDLAATGSGFLGYQDPCQRAFSKVSRAGLELMRNHERFAEFSFKLDRDTAVSRTALYNANRYARVPIDDWAFADMKDAWLCCATYENENDLWSEELVEFRRIGDAVEGYRTHTIQLKQSWIDLDWKSIDMSLTDDVPTAVIHMTISKTLQGHIDAFMAFCEVATAAEGYRKYKLPPYFPKFLRLPAEIGELVIHEYLLMEREADRLSLHCHYDCFGSRCCVWDYPGVLIACDNQNPNTLPPPETARALRGRPPTLAFTSKPMSGELIEIMLRRTARFDLKYIERTPNFKIPTWLRKFIAALNSDGTKAVKYLNFPHMYKYNDKPPYTLENSSVELMLACTNLRQVDMTFHVTKLRKIDPDSALWVPRTVMDLVRSFQLWPMFGCKHLEEIYFDGIYYPPSRGGDPDHLIALKHLAKFFMKGFLVRQGRRVKVQIARRWGACGGVELLVVSSILTSRTCRRLPRA